MTIDIIITSDIIMTNDIKNIFNSLPTETNSKLTSRIKIDILCRWKYGLRRIKNIGQYIHCITSI